MTQTEKLIEEFFTARANGLLDDWSLEDYVSQRLVEMRTLNQPQQLLQHCVFPSVIAQHPAVMPIVNPFTNIS